MGVKKRPGVWIEAGEDFPEVTNAPDQLLYHWHDWHSDDQDLDFSQFWNKHVKYPHCRFYNKRESWRFYFNTDAEITAWLLGAELSRE